MDTCQKGQEVEKEKTKSIDTISLTKHYDLSADVLGVGAAAGAAASFVIATLSKTF